jgi:hypothetical protein
VVDPGTIDDFNRFSSGEFTLVELRAKVESRFKT